MILNDTPVIFKDSFDTKNPGINSRTGDLDPNVWGVSRAIGGNVNFGQSLYNAWPATNNTVLPPNDIVISNGQLHETVNDNSSGAFEAGDVTVLAMYPKQPFDFAGRTGTVAFDISNDSHGIHAAWPEFWVTDTPVPAPFNHFDSWQSLPQHGFGIRFAAACGPNNIGSCPNNHNLSQPRWTVDSAAVVRNYVLDDTNGFGPGTVHLNILDCVIAPPDNSGITNHVEIRVSQNLIEIYATDAGVAPTLTTLRKIATLTNANLTFSRGLVWLEDVHYNADKGDRSSQKEHTFVWDNLEFDGPFTYRDFSYDAPDANIPVNNFSPKLANNLGKLSLPGHTATWNVLGLPANPNPAAVRVLFNFHNSFEPIPNVINVIVNGHVHPTPWPYPDQRQATWRTLSVTIPVTDLVTGTNVVQLGSDSAMVSANVNIVLVNVPGGVPVLPGSDNTYPSGNPPPPPPSGVTCTVTVGSVSVQTIQQGNTATFSIPVTVSCQ